jgi:hypothetical protein
VNSRSTCHWCTPTRCRSTRARLCPQPTLIRLRPLSTLHRHVAVLILSELDLLNTARFSTPHHLYCAHSALLSTLHPHIAVLTYVRAGSTQHYFSTPHHLCCVRGARITTFVHNPAHLCCPHTSVARLAPMRTLRYISLHLRCVLIRYVLAALLLTNTPAAHPSRVLCTPLLHVTCPNRTASRSSTRSAGRSRPTPWPARECWRWPPAATMAWMSPSSRFVAQLCPVGREGGGLRAPGFGVERGGGV